MGWFINNGKKNPIKMEDLGVPLFLETPICVVVFVGQMGPKKRRIESLLFKGRRAWVVGWRGTIASRISYGKCYRKNGNKFCKTAFH